MKRETPSAECGCRRTVSSAKSCKCPHGLTRPPTEGGDRSRGMKKRVQATTTRNVARSEKKGRFEKQAEIEFPSRAKGSIPKMTGGERSSFRSRGSCEGGTPSLSNPGKSVEVRREEKNNNNGEGREKNATAPNRIDDGNGHLAKKP